MQASGPMPPADGEGRVNLAIRIAPSVRRRVLRMARLTDAGTTQAWVEQAVMRCLREEEARLQPLLDAMVRQQESGVPFGRK